jgi:LuxR family maltose regulon positive regulatory protein
MEIAADENLISFFAYNNDLIDTGLLEEVFKNHFKTNIPDKFINNVKSALERRNKPKKAGIGIDLSTREMDILRLIPEDLSNQEIADKLFISLNTVKTHLKNIYLKLETDSRTKTIAKAKELGIM